jgi:phage gpG-like protein
MTQVHQEGGLDRVAPGGAIAKYPARPLLGFNAVEKQTIVDHILEYLHSRRL